MKHLNECYTVTDAGQVAAIVLMEEERMMQVQFRYPTHRRYAHNWYKVSRTIRRLAGGRCEQCGVEAALSVHHIGTPYAGQAKGNRHDKHDVRRENLQALCAACHDAADNLTKVQKKREKAAARRATRLEQHRALGISVGLVVYEEREDKGHA